MEEMGAIYLLSNLDSPSALTWALTQPFSNLLRCFQILKGTRHKSHLLKTGLARLSPRHFSRATTSDFSNWQVLQIACLIISDSDIADSMMTFILQCRFGFSPLLLPSPLLGIVHSWQRERCVFMFLSNCTKNVGFMFLDLLVFVIFNCFEIAFPDQGGSMGLHSQDCKVKCKMT